MNYVLVVFQTSMSLEFHNRERLTSIMRRLGEIANEIEGSKVLAENCFLLPVQNGLQVLPSLERIAQEAGLKCVTEFLSRTQ